MLKIINKFFYQPKVLVITSVAFSIALVGCNTTSGINNQKVAESPKNERELQSFAGCYTVSKNKPAQIKVSKHGFEWVMQMKEPPSAERVWDAAEPLEVIDKSEIPTYFSIDPDNVDAVIARPDRVLVLAHVKPVYASTDPLLDSEYLSYIYRGANTIYKVACDDIKMSF